MSDDAVRGMLKVLEYREGNIYKAMLAIKDGMWNLADRYIRAEIERLESERGGK